MKIIGLSCGAHDTAYCVFEDGRIILHEEYERFSRVKEQQGDVLQFLFDRYPDLSDCSFFSHFFMKWNGGLKSMFPESFSKLENLIVKNNAKYLEISHHLCHAANAFFSSNFKKSIILSLDGGGEETENGIDKSHESCFSIFYGEENKITKILDLQTSLDIGGAWSKITKEVFKLSSGPPQGNQCGTVMAMAAVGRDHEKYDEDMKKYILFKDSSFFEKWSELSTEEKYSLSSSLQYCTEEIVIEAIEKTFKKLNDQFDVENLCIVGGVALNGLLNNKIANHFSNFIKNIYIPPVPYDAGLAIGCCQYIYYSILNNKREYTQKNSSPYLGIKYSKDEILREIKDKKLEYRYSSDDEVIGYLENQKIISIFNESSESGRRALGNRSIFADPRLSSIKDIINSKIKHRQWFRPFAPIILYEKMSEWFEKTIESPYMNVILPFRNDAKSKVPAVVHFDGTGRVQTIKQSDNEWVFNFLKKWDAKTGIPVLLNTSFNDREPIVETPEHAINCFLKTKIDHLYFPEYGILLSK